MSLRASLKVPKNGLFYFKSDRTTSIVPLNKIVKVISSDNVSKGSKVELNYEGVTLEAEIIGVNAMYGFYVNVHFLVEYLFADKMEKVGKVTVTHFGNLHYFHYPRQYLRTPHTRSEIPEQSSEF